MALVGGEEHEDVVGGADEELGHLGALAAARLPGHYHHAVPLQGLHHPVAVLEDRQLLALRLRRERWRFGLNLSFYYWVGELGFGLR